MSEHPDKIFMQLRHGAICTHCTDQINDDDVRYVIATPLTDAAPDLLEALERMLDCFRDTEGSHGQWEEETTDKARAAIAKATGEK